MSWEAAEQLRCRIANRPPDAAVDYASAKLEEIERSVISVCQWYDRALKRMEAREEAMLRRYRSLQRISRLAMALLACFVVYEAWRLSR